MDLVGCEISTAVMASGCICVCLNVLPSRVFTTIESVGVLGLLVLFISVLVSGLSLPEELPPQQRPISGSLAANLALLGIMSMCTAGHPVLPSMYGNCGQVAQQQYTSVLWNGIAISSGLCSLLGALGYYYYGSHTEDSIILNIGAAVDGAALPGLRGLELAVLVTMSTKLFSSFPFFIQAMTEPVMTMTLKEQSEGSLAPGFISFTITVLATVLAVSGRNQLPSLSAVSGCMLTTVTNVIFPCLCYASLVGQQKGKVKLYFALFALLAGLVLGILGTVNAVQSLSSEDNITGTHS